MRYLAVTQRHANSGACLSHGCNDTRVRATPEVENILLTCLVHQAQIAASKVLEARSQVDKRDEIGGKLQ